MDPPNSPPRLSTRRAGLAYTPLAALAESPFPVCHRTQYEKKEILAVSIVSSALQGDGHLYSSCKWISKAGQTAYCVDCLARDSKNTCGFNILKSFCLLVPSLVFFTVNQNPPLLQFFVQ